jgi:hypothetical protein
MELTAYHGFIQYVKQPTHRKGGTLDHIYVNRFFDDSEHLSVIPVHYSDHFQSLMVLMITVCLNFQTAIHWVCLAECLTQSLVHV